MQGEHPHGACPPAIDGRKKNLCSKSSTGCLSPSGFPAARLGTQSGFPAARRGSRSNTFEEAFDEALGRTRRSHLIRPWGALKLVWAESYSCESLRENPLGAPEGADAQTASSSHTTSRRPPAFPAFSQSSRRCEQERASSELLQSIATALLCLGPAPQQPPPQTRHAPDKYDREHQGHKQGSIGQEHREGAGSREAQQLVLLNPA